MFRARRCTQDDFGSSNEAIRLFQHQKSKYLICPDFKGDDDIILQSDNDDVLFSKLQADIIQCSNGSNIICKS